MRSLRILCCLLTVIALGAGCGDDQSDSGDTSAEGDGCAALIDRSAELAALGSASQEQRIDVGGLPACQAQVDGSNAGVDQIQVIQVPAEEWARTLPDLIDELLESDVIDDPAQRRKLEQGREMITSDDQLTPDSACELFTTLVVSLQGLEKGARSIVNVLPDPQSPLAANGQACSDGSYTSVQVESASALAVDEALLGQVRAALDDYHEGPL
ncbi:MAG TPA: hypothetical protein VFO49_03555 [Nocardioides sp.]|nr:hypothetical protein [Nocardioides sp.]